MPTKTILKDSLLKTRIPNVCSRKANGRLRRPGNHHFPAIKFKKSDDAKAATEGVFDLVEIPVSLTTNLKVEDTATAFTVLPVSGETSIHSHSLLGKQVVLCFAATSRSMIPSPNLHFIRNIGAAIQKNLKNRKDLPAISVIILDGLLEGVNPNGVQTYELIVRSAV